jgi:RNA polymerase sigma factor (sigma-70 family)
MKMTRDNTFKYLRENNLKISEEELENMFKDKEENEDKIIRSQLALAIVIVNDWYSKLNYKYNVESLSSYALEGLYKAYQRYNPIKTKKGFKMYSGQLMKNNIITNIKYKKVNENDIISTPLELSYSICDVFSDLGIYNNDEDGEKAFEDSLEAPEEVIHIDKEQDIINIIKKHLKHRNADIVISKLGLGLLNPIKTKELAKKHNITINAVNQQYNILIKKLSKNEEFKKKLKFFIKS